MVTKNNVAAVRAYIEDAEEVRSLAFFQDDPLPGKSREGTYPGGWRPGPIGLPPDCPVVPLGVDGNINWFLDTIGQLYAYTKPYGQADTLELFRGRHHYLYWAWPKFTGKSKGAEISPDAPKFEVDGWKNEKAREALIAAATCRGPWNAVEKVRGRGSWGNVDEPLIMHLGEDVLIGPDRQPPGELNGHVYPTRPKILAPWPIAVPDNESPVKMLRPLFQSWSWSRPDIDPHLLLGWIGVAFLGAALPWRSAVYMTGDKGSGKSTLQEILKLILGDWLISTTNTTAAGIYQRVGNDSLPVAVDEFEGKADSTKAKALLELARQASSGGMMLRGGDKHTGVEFMARSAFLFSSINAPPMEPQDLSRFALLRMQKLPKGQPPPDIDKKTFEVVGRSIIRRLIDQWPRYAKTLAAFKGELAFANMDGRGQDTFGTLLACADLIEFDGWDEARLSAPSIEGDMKPWRELMATHMMAEFEDATENWRGCLNHLLAVPVEAWRNSAKTTIGQVIEAWVRGEEYDGDLALVRKKLVHAGVTIQRRKPLDEWLAIPNNSPLVRKIFEGSKWVGDHGAGVWSGALRQAERGVMYDIGQAKIGGVNGRCTFISLKALYGKDGIMMCED